jgi:phage N-6-adenine-methyltransferase
MLATTETTEQKKQTHAYVGSLGRKDDLDSNSWYTPKEYVEASRRVLRGIGMDPFGSELSNKTVIADNYITEEMDAFKTDWASRRGTVFMNPPYSRGLCGLAANRFLEQFAGKRFARGIILVNNATDTKWFQPLLKSAAAVCFTDHRISFISPDGKKVSGNTRGQAFFLFESNARSKSVERFKEEFGKFGTVLGGI